MTTTNQHELILVTGGTGKTGRRVADRLDAMSGSLRVASRATNPPLDWDNPATWTAVLDGVHTAYLAYAPDAGFPGAAAILGAFARQAVDSGVRRIVLLTGRGEDGAVRSEDAVRAAADAAGAELVVLRAAFFAQNFSEDLLSEAVRHGVAFLDLEDLAEVAVTVLTQGGHAGKHPDFTEYARRSAAAGAFGAAEAAAR